MGTGRPVCRRSHTPSWPLRQVSGGCFLFSALGGTLNWGELLWRIHRKACWVGGQERTPESGLGAGTADVPRQPPELLSHCAPREVPMEAEWFRFQHQKAILVSNLLISQRCPPCLGPTRSLIPSAGPTDFTSEIPEPPSVMSVTPSALVGVREVTWSSRQRSLPCGCSSVWLVDAAWGNTQRLCHHSSPPRPQ